jgi:hypothetical protein
LRWSALIPGVMCAEPSEPGQTAPMQERATRGKSGYPMGEPATRGESRLPEGERLAVGGSGLLEDDGAAAVEQDAVLGVPAHRAG